MPTVMAGLAASLVGWLTQDLVQPYLGAVAAAILSLGVSTVLFFALRNWLRDLREG
jgi:hypothetical protein